MGNANYAMYTEAIHKYPAHYPFYDIWTGCNSGNPGHNGHCAVTGYDRAIGNSADNTNTPYCIDTIAPHVDSITFSPLSPANTSSITTQATAYDPGTDIGTGSGVNHITASINTAADGTASGSWDTMGTIEGASGQVTWRVPASIADGDHLVKVEACDNATNGLGGTGNCDLYPSPDTQAHFVLDHVPPVTTGALSGTADGESTFTSAVQVMLNATDATSGVQSTQYALDCPGGTCSTWQTYSTPFSVGTPGHHTIYFRSTDNAGNVEGTESSAFTVAFPTVTTLLAVPKDGTTAVFRGTVNLDGLPGGCASFNLHFAEGIAVLSGDSKSDLWTPGGALLNTGGSIALNAGWNIAAPVRSALDESDICSATGAIEIAPLGGAPHFCGTAGGFAVIANAQAVYLLEPSAQVWNQP